MKKFFILLFIFNLLIIKQVNSLETYVVLKVNNKIITNTDINREYKYLIALNKDLEKIDPARIKKLAKDSIIKEKIKETELINYFDLSKENKFMNQILNNFYNKLGLKNIKEFELYLSEYDLKVKDVKHKIAIETAWNDLIYQKFSKSIKINEKEIKKKIEKLILNKKEINSYLLYEIMFNTDSNETIQEKFGLIEKNVKEFGFQNTANIYSISDSSKMGGKIGWINENQLSGKIKKEILKIKKKQYTNPIPITGGLLVLYMEDKKILSEKLNFDDEFRKQISYEKNTQLDVFSKIYFKKIKNNSIISEN